MLVVRWVAGSLYYFSMLLLRTFDGIEIVYTTVYVVIPKRTLPKKKIKNYKTETPVLVIVPDNR